MNKRWIYFNLGKEHACLSDKVYDVWVITMEMEAHHSEVQIASDPLHSCAHSPNRHPDVT